MTSSRMKLIRCADESSKDQALHALFDALKAPETSVSEAVARMRQWQEAAGRPRLGLVRQAPRALAAEDVPDDEDMRHLLALGEQLLMR